MKNRDMVEQKAHSYAINGTDNVHLQNSEGSSTCSVGPIPSLAWACQVLHAPTTSAFKCNENAFLKDPSQLSLLTSRGKRAFCVLKTLRTWRPSGAGKPRYPTTSSSGCVQLIPQVEVLKASLRCTQSLVPRTRPPHWTSSSHHSCAVVVDAALCAIGAVP